MKKIFETKVKPNISYLFFLIIWLLYDRKFFNGIVEDTKHTVFITVYILSIFSVLFLKKKNIGILIAFAVAIGTCIYSIEYLFLFMPVFLLTYLYILINKAASSDKKANGKRTDFIDPLMVLLINCIVAIVIYGLVKLLNYPEYQYGAIEQRISYHSVMITVFLLIFLVFGSKRNKRKNSDNRKQKDNKTISNRDKLIDNLNIISIFIYASQLFAYYASAYHNDGHFRIMFFPWFMYILIVVYNDDSNYLAFINCVEAKIERFVNPKREDK